MRYSLLIVAMLVSACGLDPAYRAAQEEKRIARYDAACKRLGFEAGTQQLKDCRLKMYTTEVQALHSGGSTYTPQKSVSCYSSGPWTQCN